MRQSVQCRKKKLCRNFHYNHGGVPEAMCAGFFLRIPGDFFCNGIRGRFFEKIPRGFSKANHEAIWKLF